MLNESDLDEKIKEEIKSFATKAELKAEQDKTVKLQTYDISLFSGQSYTVNDGSQNYLVFQAIKKILQLFLVFHTQSQNGNLKDCQMENLQLLTQQIKVFLQN